MKKIWVLFLAVLLLAACGDDNNKTNQSNETNNSGNGSGEEANNSGNESGEEKKIYQIGETAVITSDLYDFDYEVTVTDFSITDEVDGTHITDYVSGLSEDDPTRFAVVDVTIKNISDEAYIPSEMFSANFSLAGEEAGFVSNDEFFPEADEELAPGKEVSGHVVYTHEIDDEDAYWFKYEIMSDNETIFELPNPAK